MTLDEVGCCLECGQLAASCYCRFKAWVAGEPPGDRFARLVDERKTANRTSRNGAEPLSQVNQCPSGGTAYGRAALDAEVATLRTQTDGRNGALNGAAYALGQLAAGGELDAEDVRAALVEAAEANGYRAKRGAHAVDTIIRSGMDAGARTPRGAPALSPVTGTVTPPSRLSPVSDQGERPSGDSSDRSDRRIAWTASELMAAEFAPARWAVPHLVAEGVSVLAGSPKVGKSWLALNLAVAAAAGGRALGRIDVAAGPVLYLALEDTPRRLQDRLRKVLGKDAPPDGLQFVTECEPFPVGAERIGRWLTGRDARLVVIDVFARMRGTTPHNVAAYDADYAAVRYAKQLADTYGVAVLLVHHTRKAAATDVLDEVSGTQGLAGAADAVMVLKRARGEADAVLHITGRDVEEAEHALSFAADIGAWQLLDGPAYTHTLTDSRKAIHDYLAGYPGQPGPKEIATATGLDYDLVKQTVRRMVEAGQLRSDGRGHYTTPVTAVTTVTFAGQGPAEGVTELSPHLSPVTDDGPAQ